MSDLVPVAAPDPRVAAIAVIIERARQAAQRGIRAWVEAGGRPADHVNAAMEELRAELEAGLP